MFPYNQQIIHSIRPLHGLSKAINSTLNPTQVEEMLLRKTAQLIRSDRVLILLLDMDKKSLLIHNALGFEPSELPSVKFENIASFDHCIVHKGSVITLAEVLCQRTGSCSVRLSAPAENVFCAAGNTGTGVWSAWGRRQGAGFFQDRTGDILFLGQPGCGGDGKCRYVSKKLRETFLHTAEALAEAVNSRDSYTGGHTRRVRHYALQLAEAIGLNTRETDGLQLAAILYDIDKIGIDDAILRKSGQLTDEE